jgi:hypothetical protein
MFAQSPTDVIPRARQAIGTKQTMMTIAPTGRNLIVLDIVPKGSKVNRLDFIDCISLDLSVNCPHRIQQAIL